MDTTRPRRVRPVKWFSSFRVLVVFLDKFSDALRLLSVVVAAAEDVDEELGFPILQS